MIIKRKLYTQYDDTDRLKQMKDSDILAEKKRKTGGYGGVVGATVAGLAAGGTVGAATGALGGWKGGVRNVLNRAGKWGKVGMAVGGTAAAVGSMIDRGRKAKENQFYNNRLEFAQRQARRREKKDWNQNMTQRETYTY